MIALSQSLANRRASSLLGRSLDLFRAREDERWMQGAREASREWIGGYGLTKHIMQKDLSPVLYPLAALFAFHSRSKWISLETPVESLLSGWPFSFSRTEEIDAD